MDIIEIAGRMDLTLLRPEATKRDIEALARQALSAGAPFATLCVPPCHVGCVKRLLGGAIRVSTVAGFPFGFDTPGAKAFQAKEAADSGASEIDMVMNISLFKSGEFAPVEDEIAGVVDAVPGLAVKVIVETCYLTEVEKKAALNLSVRAGAHFVKTSTGFGPEGATIEDVRLLKEWASGRISVKASGGIRDLAAAKAFIEAGAERIGTSNGIRIIEEARKGV